MTELIVDLFDARLVQGAAGLLATFNVAGVLDASDVHIAVRLGRLAGVADDEVLLAAALAVRGAPPRSRPHRPRHHRPHGRRRRGPAR